MMPINNPSENDAAITFVTSSTLSDENVVYPSNLQHNYSNTQYTKSVLPLSNNNFHAGYFYPTQLSPIYEPDTESVSSGSPVHLPLTNGLYTNYSLLSNNNNNSKDECITSTRVTDTPKVPENTPDKKGNVLYGDRVTADISTNCGKKAESDLIVCDDKKFDETEHINGKCDDKGQASTMLFKSVLSAKELSKKLTKFRVLQFGNSSSPNPTLPPIVTINNDAIISSPFKTKFINQFKSSNNTSKGKDHEGEVQIAFLV